MTAMQKLLITGVSGFLGWNIAKYIEKNMPEQWHQIDLTNNTALNQFFTDHKPDAVIHAAAASKPNDCENNPEMSHKINVQSSLQIAQLCKTTDIRSICKKESRSSK